MLDVLISPNMGKGAPMGRALVVSERGIIKYLQVVHTKPFIDICYDFAAVLHVIFWLPPFGKDNATVGYGKLLYAVSTNYRCIWHRLTAICDARFDWGLWAPSLGKGVVVGFGDGSPD